MNVAGGGINPKLGKIPPCVRPEDVLKGGGINADSAKIPPPEKRVCLLGTSCLPPSQNWGFPKIGNPAPPLPKTAESAKSGTLSIPLSGNAESAESDTLSIPLPENRDSRKSGTQRPPAEKW
jgi:hypothetical protein